MGKADFEPLVELRSWAARFALSIAESWELPPVADRALSGGVFSPSLAELSMLQGPTMSDIEPLFRQALKELGLPLPSLAEAAWILTRECMERVVAEPGSPFELLDFLKRVYWAADDVLPNGKYAGDGLDIAALYGLYWSYTEPNENYYKGRVITDESERRAIIDELVRCEARGWLDRHPMRPDGYLRPEGTELKWYPPNVANLPPSRWSFWRRFLRVLKSKWTKRGHDLQK
jgi:hypothetical protein